MRRAGGGAGGDEGFTLVELMIVILIIGILIAIGLPTFLGARERSQDRAAQALLRNALTAGKVYLSSQVERQDYSNPAPYSTLLDALKAIEPSLVFEEWGGNPDDREKVGVVTLKELSGDLLLSTASASGHVFCLIDSGAGTTYGRLESVIQGQPCWVNPVQYPTPQQGWAPPP